MFEAPTVTSTPNTVSSSRLSVGAIVGIAIGSLVFVGFVAYLCQHHTRQSYTPSYSQGGYGGNTGYGSHTGGSGGYRGGGRAVPLVEPYKAPKEDTYIHGALCPCYDCKQKRANRP